MTIESKFKEIIHDYHTQRWLNYLEMLDRKDFMTRWLRIYQHIILNWKSHEMKDELMKIDQMEFTNFGKRNLEKPMNWMCWKNSDN
jgi:hypothetical protein